MAYDIGAIVLEWRNLEQLGISQAEIKSFDDCQFCFFQSFQAIPKKVEYAKPDQITLESKLRSTPQHCLARKLIIHGVFVQISSEASASHLMTPFIYCLEMLFNESNKIAAKRHLKVCLWMLSMYDKLQRFTAENDYLHFNQCICESIQYHKNNHNLAVHGVEAKYLKRDCYKNHLSPLQILLRNIHHKQRVCASLDVSDLIYGMLSGLGINTNLCTLYVTLTDTQKESVLTEEEGWACNACTFINNLELTACAMCNTAKPQTKYDFLVNGNNAMATIKYKQSVVEQCKKSGTNVGVTDLHLKINVHGMSIGHIRLLFQTGISPLGFQIRDECTKTICDIEINEILNTFDCDFSVLDSATCDVLEDIYPLMVIHFEAKKDLIRVLSLCQLCGSSTILRNYFPLISDYMFGDSFKNDNIYDNNVRMKYCKYHLTAAENQKGVRNADFFVYWLSRYCVTDTQFLDYYARHGSLDALKKFCSQRDALKPLLYQFDGDSYEKYNSYYY